MSGVVLNIDPKTNLAEAFNITIPPNTIATDESYRLAYAKDALPELLSKLKYEINLNIVLQIPRELSVWGQGLYNKYKNFVLSANSYARDYKNTKKKLIGNE